MQRQLFSKIQEDLQKKMVFLSGPRQSGKTTLAKELLGKKQDVRYFNWDNDQHRDILLKSELPASPGLIVLDEIHKYLRWRNWLKGIYDTHKDRYQILVTGSAKLDFYRRGGDSLQGRYNLFRLHPLSFKEVGGRTQSVVEDFLRLGAFPEPFLAQSESEARRWSLQYRSRIVREELASLERVMELSLVEQLLMRLQECVGSQLSINSLRNDIQTSHQTLARWIDILERIFAIFRIYPLSSSKVRALKKEPKLYHFDWLGISDPGARFENMIAYHLLKWCHSIEDTEGHEMELRYFRDRDQREVDFVVLKDRKPVLMVEAKLSDRAVAKDLKYLKRKFPSVEAVQVVLNLNRDFRNADDIRVCGAHHFLAELA